MTTIKILLIASISVLLVFILIVYIVNKVHEVLVDILIELDEVRKILKPEEQ